MERVGIVGLACRFPGARGPDEYWRLLHEGVCAIREVPPERWDAAAYYDPDPAAPYKMVTKWGGFVDDVDKFDPAFWRILPREAQRMDPQHRLLLELTWEALEDAGLTREALAGSATGVFVGLSGYDYGRMQAVGAGDAFACYCSAFSIAANRVSYLFDLRGPSLTLDTACSSSLVALHLARESIARGECEMAVVAGINLMLHPDLIVSLSKAGMMAPDGLCKPFDARANGYVRSDGAGVVVLKAMSKAERDGDRVYAVVHGSAVNQDGRTNGLTAPNPIAQERVLREAYACAGIAPSTVGYVEAHGTGTALGDAIEAKALGAVLGGGRPPERPLLMGSVKSNIGHTETAAGVASIIKVALSLTHGEIPSTLHHEQPNPRIDFDGLGLRVATKREPLPSDLPHIGVSGFGYGGTNAHVVLGPPPPRIRTPARRMGLELLLLSARTGDELQDLARRTVTEGLDDARDFPSVCATAALRRTAHEERLAIVAASPGEARAALTAWRSGAARASDHAARAVRAPKRPVFVCSGNGAHWLGMGRALLASEPAFADALAACDAAFQKLEGWSLVEELGREDATRLEAPGVVQPLVCALQIGLAALWRSLGITPAAVIGHSMGEVAAAHIAGMIDRDDAMRIIGARGRLLGEVAGEGGMLALGTDIETALSLAKPFEGRVELAVENAPGSVVLSGNSEDLAQIARRCEREGIWCRSVRVPVAYHSRAVDRVMPKLRRELAAVRFGAPSIPFVSTVDPEVLEPRLDADYWVRNARERVRFARAISRLAEDKHELFLELGPHPLHAEPILATLSSAGLKGRVLVSMRRNEEPRQAILASAGALWCRGHGVRLDALVTADAAVEPLPSYPFTRTRYWLDPELTVGFGEDVGHPLFRSAVEPADAPGHRYLAGEVAATKGTTFSDHRLHGVPVLPGTAFLDALALALGPGACAAEDVAFTRALVLSEDAATALQVHVREGSADGRAVAFFGKGPDDTKWAECGTARAASSRPAPEATDTADLQSRLGFSRAAADLYAGLGERGYEYGPAFRGLREFCATQDEAFAVLAAPDRVMREVGRFAIHPALLDAAFQLIAATVPEDAFVGKLLVPVRVQRIDCWLPGQAPRSAHVWRRSMDESGLLADVRIYDRTGRTIAALEGLRVAPLTGGDTLRPEWLLEQVWEKASPAPSTTKRGTWALVGSGTAVESARAHLAQIGFDARIWEDTPAELPRDLVAVTLLQARDAGADVDAPAAELDLATRTVSLAQRLLAAQDGPARLELVTWGAQSTTADERARAPGSSLAGIVKTLAFEHPELRATLIDVGPGAEDALAGALLADDDEELVALRATPGGGVERRVARLGRAKLPRARPVEGLEGGTVIVTGGLGALGIRAARTIAASGVRSLALWGRSTPTGPVLAEIETLRALGVEVIVQAVDVGDRSGVERAIAEIDARGAPVRGVLHCAGVVANAVLLELTPEHLRKVFASKVQGATTIAHALAGRELALFVLYGSVAGLLGSPGQANYAAANAWLEGFARELRAGGIPATCIAWGAWSEVGLAAAEARWAARVEATGLLSISPAQGDATLERLLRGAPPVVGVAPFDLGRLKAVVGAHPPSLFRSLVAASDSDGAEASIVASLRGLSAAERRTRIRSDLASVIGAMLGVDPAKLDTGALLGDLGIDSLLALELRTRVEARFGGRLPTTALMRQPTIDGIAEILASALAPEVVTSAPDAGGRSPWLWRKPRNEAPSARLYCFHHAGGSVGVWHRWPEGLPAGVEVCAVELPGRDHRIKEPFASSVAAIAGEVAAAIAGEANLPFAFFGHSLGAILAFETARVLASKHGIEPAHLVVASCRGPHLTRAHAAVRPLSDAALIERLAQYGGLPAQLLAAGDVMEALLPRIRADLALLDDYVGEPGPLLTCNITACTGAEDAAVSSEDVGAWRELTSGSFSAHRFPGGHFFLEKEREALLAVVSRALEEERVS